MSVLRRIAGAALLVAGLAPLHRLLDPARTGPAGAATLQAAEAAWTLGLTGALIVLTLAWVATRMLPGAAPTGGRRAYSRIGRLVLAPPAWGFACTVGVISFLETAWIAANAHGRAPVSVDGMAQLLHATVVARGRTSLPLGDAPAAWIVQNGIATEAGWTSIYPPGHTVALALGALLGIAWLVGPVMTAIATGVATRTLEEVAGPAVGRLTGLLLCASPFWLLLGSTHLSHTTAAAGLALLALGLVRTLASGRPALGWAILAGVGAGVAVSARPWVGLATGMALGLATWGPAITRQWRRDDRVQDTGPWALRIAAALVGGLPFAALLFVWNDRLFGGPLHLGYSAAFGPSHGLGLHADPWGNVYGATEALGYTGADLSLLGVRLLETPLPVTLMVGLGLLALPLRRETLPVAAAWALGGLGAAVAYWHHGILFGPRMLFESAPAWAALVAFVAVAAFEQQPPRGRFSRWATGMNLTAGMGLAAATLLGAISSGAPPAAPPAPSLTARPGATPPSGLVFVHGSWSSRVTARLAAAGMRRDSIETALRRNPLCAVDEYARWRAGGSDAPPPRLELTPLPGSPASLRPLELSEGNRIRIDPSVRPDATCLREMRADRFGVLEFEPLAWRSPVADDGRLRWARDLGPGGNIRRLAGEGPEDVWVWIERDGGEGVLLPYEEGMELLWGGPGG